MPRPEVSSPPQEHLEPPEDQAIADAVCSAFEPERLAAYLNEFRKRHGAVPHVRYLAGLFSVSRFLSDECLRHPEWIRELDDLHRVVSAEEYELRLRGFLADAAHANALQFAVFRRRELVRIVVREVCGMASLADVTEEISNLAEAILTAALRSVEADLSVRYGAADSLSVVALGKLGGHELNYSSDIDLMFLYGSNGETAGPQKISNREYFKKVANQLTSLLSSYTGAGVCYRIDLRLRPEGSLGEVCISLDGAKEYYAKRARDWELQMLIKARAVAGDRAVARDLLRSVEPSIYSTTLDFSTIETMSETRERISEKTRKRLRKDQFDIKLTPGGIRDIEFLVQCLQRLHGAREQSVRQGGTLYALSGLLEHDLLSASEHARLTGAYTFLRHLEHRLQLENDQQTHALPGDARELLRVAARMPSEYGFDRKNGGTQLLQTLNQHLENVRVTYDRIVHAQRAMSYTPTLSHGPLPRPEEHPALHAGRPLRDVQEALATHPELLSMLADPAVAKHVSSILQLSPYLTEQLLRWPDLLHEVKKLADHPGVRPAFEGLAAPLNDIEGLRRFYRHEMFRILAGSFCLPEPVFQTLDRTSGLAEFLIARTYRIAYEQSLTHAHAHATDEKPFVEPQQQMMVVALGRLGMREFDVSSDADVLFIIPDAESPRQRFWTRVAERMIEIVSAYTGDGPVLSMDTRLRPNGREGMLVQKESNYVEYFSHHAEAWEGIAYMKARAVAGDVERATHFLTQLQQVDWRRWGQSGRSRQDLRQMRMRLQREQGEATPLKAGEGGYYDADFILMYLRLKGAGMFFKSLNTPERIDIVEKMGHLERPDAELLLQSTSFFRAVDHALRIVTGRAEEKLPNTASEALMVARLVEIWTHNRVSADALENELKSVQRCVRELFERVFGA